MECKEWISFPFFSISALSTRTFKTVTNYTTAATTTFAAVIRTTTTAAATTTTATTYHFRSDKDSQVPFSSFFKTNGFFVL